MSGSPCHQVPHRMGSLVPTAPEDERPVALFLEFSFQSRWPLPAGLCFSGVHQSWGEQRAEAGGDREPTGRGCSETQGRAYL